MKRIVSASALATALLAAGCATTTLTSTWAAPDLDKVPFRKILVAFQNRDAGFRRSLEDTMARKIPNATQAYLVIDDDDVRDPKRVEAKARSAGFDSVVVMRIVSVDKETTYVPGMMHYGPSPYGSVWGGWGYGWNAAYDPGYLRTDSIATVSTNVYALASEKLVWASRSESFNPASPVKLVEEVVEANADAARKALGKK